MYLLPLERYACEQALQGSFGFGSSIPPALTLARAPSRTCEELLESIVKILEMQQESAGPSECFFHVSLAILAREDSRLTDILLCAINKLGDVPLPYRVPKLYIDTLLWDLDGPCNGKRSLERAVYLFENAECKTIPAKFILELIHRVPGFMDDLVSILPDVFFEWIATVSEGNTQTVRIAFEMLETLLRNPSFSQRFIAREEFVVGTLRALEVNTSKNVLYPLLAINLDLPRKNRVREKVLAAAIKVLLDHSKTAHSDETSANIFCVLYEALLFDSEMKSMLDQEPTVTNALQQLHEGNESFQSYRKDLGDPQWHRLQRNALAVRDFQWIAAMIEYVSGRGDANKLWSESIFNMKFLQSNAGDLRSYPYWSDALPASFWRALMQLARDHGESLVHALSDGGAMNGLSCLSAVCDPNERNVRGLTPIRAQFFNRFVRIDVLQFLLSHPRTELDGSDGPFLDFFLQHRERLYDRLKSRSENHTLALIRILAARGVFSEIRTYDELKFILHDEFWNGWHRLDLFSLVISRTLIGVIGEYDAFMAAKDELTDLQTRDEYYEELEMFYLMLRRYVMFTIMCCASERSAGSDSARMICLAGQRRARLTRDLVQKLAEFLD